MPNSINRVLARNLAYWMEQATLTQSALAEKAGVSQKTISNYLNPQQRQEGATGKEPSAKLTELEKIAKALSVSVWQLVREMTPSERKMYEAIERAYEELHGEPVTTETDELTNKQALRNASITKKARAAKKKRG
jgi:transcriptional regulator with XRE-family HTH domain